MVRYGVIKIPNVSQIAKNSFYTEYKSKFTKSSPWHSKIVWLHLRFYQTSNVTIFLVGNPSNFSKLIIKSFTGTSPAHLHVEKLSSWITARDILMQLSQWLIWWLFNVQDHWCKLTAWLNVVRVFVTHDSSALNGRRPGERTPQVKLWAACWNVSVVSLSSYIIFRNIVASCGESFSEYTVTMMSPKNAINQCRRDAFFCWHTAYTFKLSIADSFSYWHQSSFGL